MRHHIDDWQRCLDQLNNEGWCAIPAWKLRLWFDTKRISAKQWVEIIEKGERRLGGEEKILALYNDEKSDHALFIRTNSFKAHSTSKNKEVVEQIRAWIAELE